MTRVGSQRHSKTKSVWSGVGAVAHLRTQYQVSEAPQCDNCIYIASRVIHSFSSLSNDRPKASSKASSPHSAI